MEARGYLAPLLVEIDNPAVELLDLTEEVHMVGGRGAFVLEPDKLGWVQDSGDHKLIVGVWVVSILESTTLLNWRMLATIAVLDLPLARSLRPALRRILMGLVDLP